MSFVHLWMEKAGQVCVEGGGADRLWSWKELESGGKALEH